MLSDKTYRVNLIMYPATLQKYFRNGLKNAKEVPNSQASTLIKLLNHVLENHVQSIRTLTIVLQGFKYELLIKDSESMPEQVRALMAAEH